jgi:hypothetical protein
MARGKGILPGRRKTSPGPNQRKICRKKASKEEEAAVLVAKV